MACWSKKLTSAQARCSTMKKESLEIVLCLKKFKTVFLEAIITFFSDHKNLAFKTLNTTRALRWRLFLEECDAKFECFPDKDNVLAHCFSRLPRMEKPSTGKDAKVEKSAFQQ